MRNKLFKIWEFVMKNGVGFMNQEKACVWLMLDCDIDLILIYSNFY
jgi:hypothetical protein